MKYLEKKQYLVLQKKLGLYVAESHYFDAKGKRQITLTDDISLAEQMSLPQANNFVNSEKNYRDYEIIEAREIEDFDEEVDDEDEE